MMKAYIFALMAALFWGAGFIGCRYGLESLGPLWLCSARFFVAALCFLPFIIKVDPKKFKSHLIPSSIGGLILASMMVLQIMGLEYTTVAKSGFITILYAFFTPVICYFMYKRKISSMYWTTLSIALFGMFMISDMSVSHLNKGDFLTLVCSVFSACHIIFVDKSIKQLDILLFNFIQISVVCMITAFFGALFDGIPNLMAMSSNAFLGIIFMGIFSTSIAFVFQLKAQKKLAPHIVSLMFLLESPIAAAFGYSFFDETLSEMAIIGCFVVMISVALMVCEDYVQKSARLFMPIKRSLAKLSSLF